jgi:hypothetical protein
LRACHAAELDERVARVEQPELMRIATGSRAPITVGSRLVGTDR